MNAPAKVESAPASAMAAQPRRARAHKTGWYNQLPTGLGPLLYFLYRYLFQLGFLDGRAGLIYHVLQGFWYRFLVDAKRVELEQAMAQATDDEARIDALSAASGHDLRAFHGATQAGLGKGLRTNS